MPLSRTLPRPSRGGSSFEAMNTAASTMAAVVSEARLAAAARGIGARPFWHIHLSPSAAMDEAGLRKAVAVVCREMGVTDHPIGVEYHSKPRRHGGAEIHAHLVIGRAAWSGNLLASGFEKIRLEGACRVAEFEAGDQHVLGRHHASTVRRLTKVGRLDVIESLRRVHGDNPPKPRGSLSPEKRQKLARLGVDGAAARAAVKLAWDISDDGRSFGQALIDNGFAIKHGDKPRNLDRHRRRYRNRFRRPHRRPKATGRCFQTPRLDPRRKARQPKKFSPTRGKLGPSARKRVGT